MTLYEFRDLFVDDCLQKIKIFDLDCWETIFEDTFYKLPENLEDIEISSIDHQIDSNDVLTINIHKGEN